MPAKKSTPRKRSSATPANPGPPGDAKAITVVYVHGLANKPEEHVLKRQWDRALFGFDLGERSRMAYWVNRDRHGPPLGETDDPDELAAMEPRPGFSRRSVARGAEGAEDGILPPGATREATQSLARLEAEMLAHQPKPSAPGTYGKRILPLPKIVRDWITKGMTRQFLSDAHDLFFDPAERRRMGESLRSRLRTGGSPFVIIAHSQGSMIAYDVLRNWDATRDGEIQVPLFITIGSPLGLTEVKDQMKRLTDQKRLTAPDRVGAWMNFADPWDYVALDGTLGDDYGPAGFVEDVEVDNPVEKNPHSGIGYLGTPEVRAAVLGAVQKSLFQKVSGFTVTRDLARAMDQDPGKRHAVLVELQDREPYAEDWVLRDGGRPKGTEVPTAVKSGEKVRQWILERVRQTYAAADQPIPSGKKADDDLAEEIDLEVLQSYVSARLTRAEVEELASRMRGVAVFRVFKNGAKRRHVRDSLRTIQAGTAHLGYQARGAGICWAVLDTEVDARHPHFRRPDGTRVVEHVFDCTRNGVLQEIAEAKNRDVDGHGTHVAGIIAGSMPGLGIEGIAPEARLRSYKVLGDNGDGSDAKIIKALDHIFQTNREASDLQIHGVNLSLGGGFDPEAFGCGDTPLCKELRKLWRQGVVVIISAGNEGQSDIPGVGSINHYLSIGDPANLDESIVVGSVHCTKPHLYGVSYFSSRGPTADGRAKPDVVAPGEKILSCRALEGPAGGKYGTTEAELYTRMSGTSMAAPHVSGLIACFLSVRREFIGYPDRVKKLLLQCSTDLERDPRCQGAGLVNLVKMLLQT